MSSGGIHIEVSFLVFQAVSRIRIWTLLVGSGSGRLGPDRVPDLDPGLNK
jgi:hypothetical protein